MDNEKWFLKDIYCPPIKKNSPENGSFDLSIKSELINKSIPDDVIDEAMRISNELGINPRKGDKKKGLIFCCVYYAYKNLGKVETPKNVAAMLDFPIKKVQNKLSKFNYNGNNNIVSFVDIIPRCCEDLKIMNDYLNEIKVFSVKLRDSLNPNSILNEKFPQDVAYCVIIFYLNIQGITFDLEFIKEKTGISTTSINVITKEISSAYNEMR